MQNALHLQTTVLPGGRIEVTNRDLPLGAPVDLFILLPESPAAVRRSAVDILAEAPGQRLFKTAEEVDRHVREERDSWDR